MQRLGQLLRRQGFSGGGHLSALFRRGQVIATPCPAALGKGEIEQQRELSVEIPAGVDSGARLRLRGEGEKRA